MIGPCPGQTPLCLCAATCCAWVAKLKTSAKDMVMKKVFQQLGHWLNTLRQRDLEAYLAAATDINDLEARMRARERSSFYS